MSRIRRTLRVALARDNMTFARRWPGKALVAAVLVALPVVLLVRSVRGGSYIDDSWIAILAALVVAVSYALSRRLLATVLVTGLIVGAASLAMTPHRR